jgi:hypothetical protein
MRVCVCGQTVTGRCQKEDGKGKLEAFGGSVGLLSTPFTM